MPGLADIGAQCEQQGAEHTSLEIQYPVAQCSSKAWSLFMYRDKSQSSLRCNL